MKPILPRKTIFMDTKALELIAGAKTAVLSTIAKDGQPQAAAVSYLFVAPDLFYFVVGKESAKFRNIVHDNRVALVVVDDSELPGTVQVEGVASAVTDEDEERFILERLVNEVWSELPFYPPAFRMPSPKLVLVKVAIKVAKWFKDEMRRDTLTLYPQVVSVV